MGWCIGATLCAMYCGLDWGEQQTAVRNLVRAWTMELKDRGIRSNVLSPGPIRTPGLMSLAHDAEQTAQMEASFVARGPFCILQLSPVSQDSPIFSPKRRS